MKIDVTDTGIGIAPENFDLVFERFKQTDPGVSRKYGGTGLGLSISRNLAELMGGQIVLASQPGKGATFSLLLPDRSKSLDVSPQRKEPQQISKDSEAPLPENDIRILVVEDHDPNVMVIGHFLEDAGYGYDVARNGQEALHMWRTYDYDLILMDIQMPVMDGFSATTAIRQTEQEKSLTSTPIIGMTAHALIDDKDKCMKAGMNAYLPKPIVEEDLHVAIHRHLKKRRRTQ